ncbi:ATPase [Aureococcus anophagefferens]|nr:ATPase [Aureococcus anophagefferens]
MAAEARYAPLNAEAPQPSSRRRCCSATALARAGACLGVAVLALGLGVVVQLQVDLARMTILSREQLALEVGPNATARHIAADARAKASFAYSWLVHRATTAALRALEPAATGCAGGYYEDPADASADGAPLACPPGMFCPEGFTCFVACLYGAACAPSTYDADADACAWAVTLKHTPSSRGYRGGANVTCPGVMFETLVPAGFYAPDPTVDPRRCPAQHYCPTGSFEPTRCPFIARCGEEGLEAPDVSSAAAAAFLGSFFFFFMLYHSSRLVRAELRRFRERQRETLEAGLDAILDRRAAARGSSLLGEAPPAAGDDDDRSSASANPFVVGGDDALDLPSLPRKAEAERIDVGFADLGLEEDTMCTELTVNEILLFSAATRLPRASSSAFRRAVVRDVLRVLRIERLRHAVVGDAVRRGISGGQRKRVNVGIELVADPTLLFADEPTSGLDSATSTLFDDVLLLAPGGRTAYLGAPGAASAWFENLGFGVPPDWSPPDFFMQILALDAAGGVGVASGAGRPGGRRAGAAARRRRRGSRRASRPSSRCSSAARASSSGGPRLRGGVAAQILAGGGLGLLYVDFKFKNLQLVNFMVSIALGMTLTLAAVPTLARDRAVFLRESRRLRRAGAGRARPRQVADLPRLGRSPSSSSSASTRSRGRAGVGARAPLRLGALSVALLFAMFSGVHPTLAAMPAALKVVHYASHDRYFVEALFVEEVARMSEAFRLPPTFYADASSSALAQMLNYGYLVEDASVYWDHHKLRYINVATLLGLGAVARLLAFALLLRTSAAALGRPAPLAALCLRRRRAAPPPPPRASAEGRSPSRTC